MGELRALTIRQPYAWAIAHGRKTVENRSRPISYRGPLAIHAGGYFRWDLDGQDNPLVQQAWRDWIKTLPADNVAAWPLRRDALHLDFSAVIAVASVYGCHADIDCEDATPDREELRRCSPWAMRGQWHWVLSDVRPLPKPVPCKGALGLWKPTPDTERAVMEQLAASNA